MKYPIATLAIVAFAGGLLLIARLTPTREGDGFASTHIVTPPTREQIAADKAKREEYFRIKAGGEHYLPLQRVVDMPGNDAANLMSSFEIDFADETPIVGIERVGKAVAFAIDGLRGPKRHIVNLMIGNKPVSVTYCDKVDCVRALTTDSQSPIPLRVGGMDINDQMVVILNNTRYGQSSLALPLTDFPFERTTWGKWKRQHPDSKIFISDLNPERFRPPDETLNECAE